MRRLLPESRMPALLRRHLDLVLLLVVGLPLMALPQIDLYIAALFYDPFDGFFLKQQPLAQFVFHLVPWITRSVVITLLIFLLLAWTLWRRREIFLRWRRTALYLLLVMIVGPGLLVNSVFKDNWGRARPSQVQEFGGTQEFTRAGQMTDQCVKNCSFVSGHASVGFYFLAFAFAFPRRRRLWLITGSALGLGVGLVRIVQGGHFFSDVIFSGIVVYLAARVLHALMFPASRTQPAQTGQ